jgi:16S rRNA processing protein RimM
MAQRNEVSPRSTGLLCVGVVTGARGLRGEIWIKSFTANPAAVAAYGPVLDEHGQQLFAIRTVDLVKGRVAARASGIDNRTSAEELKGQKLFVSRQALPELDGDEYYHADLVGLTAELEGDGESPGRYLGIVRAVHDFGAGDVIEIHGDSADGDSADVQMVPFTRAAVPVVDFAARRIVIAEIPGLLNSAAEQRDAEDGEGDQ